MVGQKLRFLVGFDLFRCIFQMFFNGFQWFLAVFFICFNCFEWFCGCSIMVFGGLDSKQVPFSGMAPNQPIVVML